MIPVSQLGAIERELGALANAGLGRKMRSSAAPAEPEIDLDGRRTVSFGSNNYLSLASHPEVKEAARSAIEKFGAGAGASRLISGNHAVYADLESALAEFLRTESAVVFSSGYLANLGAIAALAGNGDAIACDRLNHASLIDGCRISGARMLVYPHRDAQRLGEILRSRRGRFRNMLIVTDGLFSMDGDLAPLPELAVLAEEFDCLLLVDDAHGFGVMGEKGRGSLEETGVDGGARVVRIGTLSKAMGAAGGFVAGSRLLCEYLVNRARTLIFETGLPAATAAAALAALNVARREPERRERLRKMSRTLRKMVREAGFEADAGSSPIIPLMAGANDLCMRWMEMLLDRGIYVPGVRPPTVPAGRARLRISLQSGHTDAQMRRLAEECAALHGEKRS